MSTFDRNGIRHEGAAPGARRGRGSMDALTVTLFIIGLVLLIGGAEALIRGASRLAAAVGISPLVIGLTVVAFGTSAPELAVSVQSSYRGQADLAVGNVVGSNICNVILILGLSAAIAPLVVAARLVWLDVPLMIGVSVLFLVLGLDGTISRPEGLLLFLGAVAYTVWAIRQSRAESPDVHEEYARKYGAGVRGGGTLAQLGLIAAGLGMLVLGSNWLVAGAVAFARALGVSELIIGLTVIALGTSLPEVAASVIATIRGERDIAVGNVVGSNLFNILVVLGLTGVVAPEGVRVSPGALTFDIPVMIAVAVACLPVFFTGHQIARWEGFLFLGYYAAYMAYLVLDAAEHDAARPFGTVMLAFVVPITVLTLAVLAAAYARSRRRDPE
jgi:cation:H+ antiporter